MQCLILKIRLYICQNHISSKNEDLPFQESGLKNLDKKLRLYNKRGFDKFIV